MRVLIVSQYFWPESFRINDVVKTLAGKGVDIEVLTGKPNYPEGSIYSGYRFWGFRRESWGGATVHRVPLAPRGAKGAFRLAVNYFSFVAFGLLCGAWILRGRRYDVIFVYGVSPILQAIPALFLGGLKRSPVIIWVQDSWPESLEATGYVCNRLALGAVRLLVRWIYRRADLLLVQSRAFEPVVAALAPGKPIAYYPNSVDASFCSPPAAPTVEIPGLDGGFSVMFAGNIGAAQAVEVIVEAAWLLKDRPEIRFVILGQGSRWEWMRRQAEIRGLSNLHLPGRFPVEMMPGLMRKASALLVTLTDRPTFAATVPNKVQAYMAAGKPILACLNGEGARVVSEAGAGLAVPAESARALADAVLRLYGMTAAQRERLGANGRNYFKEHFDHERLVDQLIEHFRAASKYNERASPAET